MNESGGGDEKKNGGGGHRKQPQISRSSFSNLPPRRGFGKKRDDSVSIANVLPVVESYDEMKDHDDHTIRNCKPSDEVEMKEKMQIEDHAEINCPTMDDSPGNVV
ncbi:hypothetical protein LOK49_LG01G02615 [Camellia lanceoleosa]|uniref:Uncharacterized protein n=1 Tax=Camellia lanceoleosa TaxID=1840588 RepID=A0ACC0J0D4_9ERIC|nr:hypothetical protein LOK49_LG01G02615 [Camellia lanceoleosa]